MRVFPKQDKEGKLLLKDLILAQLVRKCKISALEECKSRYAQTIAARYKVTWLGWIQKAIEKKTQLPFEIDYSTWIRYKSGCCF